jgi:hypothetical protein
MTKITPDHLPRSAFVYVQLDFALRQARFKAARAHRQYDAIDPDNRLVAEELERRWNERLVAVRSLESEINQLDAGTKLLLTSVDQHLVVYHRQCVRGAPCAK